jgi:hypothetical protein
LRVWDVPAGYLNRESLLGEHRELHGLYNIVTEGKDGYSRHPETIRWAGCGQALSLRHALLVAEMRLRGYVDRTPLVVRRMDCRWPAVFVTEPAEQLALLEAKYVGKSEGRIPLPRGVHQLWAQHKYSVLARDPETYRSIGRAVARLRRGADMSDLTCDLVALLRTPPPHGRLVNAVEHMWGYVREGADESTRANAARGPAQMLSATQALACASAEPFLLASTALSELAVFAGRDRPAAAPRR